MPVTGSLLQPALFPLRKRQWRSLPRRAAELPQSVGCPCLCALQHIFSHPPSLSSDLSMHCPGLFENNGRPCSSPFPPPIPPDDSEKRLHWRALAACSYRFCLTALTAKDARHCPNESQQVIHLRLLLFLRPSMVVSVYTGDRRGGLRNLPKAIKASQRSLSLFVHCDSYTQDSFNNSSP